MRGGRREGAGRKADDLVGPLVKVTAWLPADFAAWAKAEGRGSISKGIRQLLEELDQRQGAESAGGPARSVRRGRAGWRSSPTGS